MSGTPGRQFLRGSRLDPEARREGRARIALVLVAIAAGVHLVFSVGYGFTRQAPDFWSLYKGAREWTRGNSL